MLGVVAPRVGRDARDTVVDHLEHRVGGHVEVHDQAFDRTGVRVVARFHVQEGDATRDAAIVLALVAEHSGRPRIDLHQIEVGDAALGERPDVFGVLLGRHDRTEGFRDEQRGSHVGVITPVDDLALRHRHDHLVQIHRRTGHHHDPDAPVDGIVRLPARQRLLLRFVQHHVREQRRVGDPTGCPQDLGRTNDLVAGQHVERMGDGHCGPLGFSELSVQRVPTTRTASA
jgi:hypothetical protein